MKDLADELEGGSSGGDRTGVSASPKQVLKLPDKPGHPLTDLHSLNKTLNDKQVLVELMREDFILINNGMKSLIKGKEPLKSSRMRLAIKK